jgi:DNA-binding XRE family transcriptional regulator
MSGDVVAAMADVTPQMTLRQLRENAGLTQNDLGKLVGRTQHCISQIESGSRRSHAPTLKKIADVLGVTVTDIREWQGRELTDAS